ncbi:MAG: lipoyl domain-containing protein [Candidatus Omnitrophica bacterium]|nr:lipoyl domain-containing protein [Candidatus Omnitrophota bacterium]
MKEQEYVILPELGEEIKSATVACWHVAEGAEVHVDDDVVEVVTDKATFNISVECPGVVKEILVQEGQEVQVGSSLAVILPSDI